jgi:hypothetical protein
MMGAILVNRYKTIDWNMAALPIQSSTDSCFLIHAALCEFKKLSAVSEWGGSGLNRRRPRNYEFQLGLG